MENQRQPICSKCVKVSIDKCPYKTDRALYCDQFSDVTIVPNPVEQTKKEPMPRQQFDNLPKPYYQDDAVTIYHADCRDILHLLPDRSIDLVVTDPPYGVNLDYKEYNDKPELWFPLMDWLIPECRRISYCTILPSCKQEQLPYIYTHYPPDWLICWYKGSPGILAHVGFNDWEPHLVYGKVKGTQYHDYFYAPPSDNNGFNHPCPKPIGWADYLISHASLKGNIILDAFLGTGTTAFSAKKLGRKCIGIEITESYCEIAAKRCSQTVLL